MITISLITICLHTKLLQYCWPYSVSCILPLCDIYYIQEVCLQCGRPRFNLWVGKFPWGRKWQPTTVFLPGEFHRHSSLAETFFFFFWHLQGLKESNLSCFKGVVIPQKNDFFLSLLMCITFRQKLGVIWMNFHVDVLNPLETLIDMYHLWICSYN